jgi:hypothetical protein
MSGQKPPKEDVQQAEEKKNACYTVRSLTKKLEQTYYFALFFGKKTTFCCTNNKLSPVITLHCKKKSFDPARQIGQQRIIREG